MSNDLNIEKLLVEFCKTTVELGFKTVKNRSVSFRVLRQSKPNKILRPQDKDEIITLYRSMLSNPQIRNHRQDLDSVEEVKQSLDTWYIYPTQANIKCEQILVAVDYGGHIVSFMYGVLCDGVFFLWYLVGPKNIEFGSPKINYPFPPTIETIAYSQAMILTLLKELHQDAQAYCIVFAVGTSTETDPVGVERSRLRLFNQVEQEIAARSRKPLHRLSIPVLKHASHIYILRVPFVQPMFHGRRIVFRTYSLSCVPLKENVETEFRTGSISYATGKKILEGIYPSFYAFHEHDDAGFKPIKEATIKLLSEFDATYSAKAIGCCSLTEFLNDACKLA